MGRRHWRKRVATRLPFKHTGGTGSGKRWQRGEGGGGEGGWGEHTKGRGVEVVGSDILDWRVSRRSSSLVRRISLEARRPSLERMSRRSSVARASSPAATASLSLLS